MEKDKVDRLREVLKYTGLTQAKFCEKIGIYQPSLSKILKRQIACGKSITDKLQIAFAINPVWLETGEGDMILPQMTTEGCAMCAEKEKRISIMEKYIKQLEEENTRLKTQLGIDVPKKVG